MKKSFNQLISRFFPISIKVSIITNFIFLAFLISALIIGFQYTAGKDLAKNAATKSFVSIYDSVSNKLHSIDSRVVDLVSSNSFNPTLNIKPEFGKEHESLKLFLNSIELNPSLYAIYIGYSDGSFYEIINMRSSERLYKKYQVDKSVYWTVIKIDGTLGKREISFLDRDLLVVSSRSDNADYDPRMRPWYKGAVSVDSVYKTQPYMFSNLGALGVTYAKQISKDAVFAADISLATMNHFLESEKFTEGTSIFLLNNEKKLLFSTSNFTTENLPDFFQFNKIVGEVNSYDINNQEYLSKLIELPSVNGKKEYLGISVLMDELLEPYMENLLISTYLSLGIFIFIIPLIFYSAVLIIKPIKKLLLENEKVRKREYSKVQHVESIFTEIDEFSKSFINMSEEIASNEFSQKVLMDSFFTTFSNTLDMKSNYTGAHSQKVAELSMLIAKEANNSQEKEFQDLKFENEDQWREFKIGATLHDCGKVITPEYVIHKSTKLETIYNRIHEIRTRFEVIYRDLYIEYLEEKISKEDLEKKQQELKDDFLFIAETNIGGEFFDDKKLERLELIGKRTWVRNFDNRVGLSIMERNRYSDEENTPKVEKLLDNKSEHLIKRENFDFDKFKGRGFKIPVPENEFNLGELYNLSTKKGTLTEEERFIINEHIIMTINMLEMIPFPENLMRVPEYAGGHHETLDGKGYPKKLTKEEISLPARIIAIADIFEALTASDRPYKKPMVLSKALNIMYFEAKNNKLDPAILKLFLTNRVYLSYGEKFLKPEQMDDVNVEELIEKVEGLIDTER